MGGHCSYEFIFINYETKGYPLNVDSYDIKIQISVAWWDVTCPYNSSMHEAKTGGSPSFEGTMDCSMIFQDTLGYSMNPLSTN